jgi:hypothetical protein
MRVAHVLVSGALAVFADVVPHCGKPEVSIRKPGQDCGPHGSRWIGECLAPAKCIADERHGPTCTRHCTTDEDCTALGATFHCNARERESYGVDAAALKLCSQD